MSDILLHVKSAHRAGNESLLTDGNIGWSLGGFTALEVSKVLETDHVDIHVLGIVMLDSPYPGHEPVHQKAMEGMLRIVPCKPFLQDSCAPELRMLVERSMKRAHRLVEKWIVPEWTDKQHAPPVILLRCQDYVPPRQGWDDGDSIDAPATIVSVDRWRKQRMLGWEYHHTDLVRGVLDVPGHHFNVMWGENVSDCHLRACIAPSGSSTNRR